MADAMERMYDREDPEAEKRGKAFEDGWDCGVKAGYEDGIRAAIAEVEKARDGITDRTQLSATRLNQCNRIIARLRALLPEKEGKNATQ